MSHRQKPDFNPSGPKRYDWIRIIVIILVNGISIAARWLMNQRPCVTT